ncbi:MAG: type I-E CRISPR-associated protein Cas5/CasD [Desulfovibrionaceae bacterium]
MQRFLLFQIQGPLQAWGDAAVGEIRPAAARPTRSGLLGLVAACLGVRRGEEDRLQGLSRGYGAAVREDAPGRRMLDYHTVQTTRQKKNREFRRRADELGPFLDPGEDLATVLSRREYLANAAFTACLWERRDPPHPLEELAEALQRPRFAPYLGRKSCPPGLPFAPNVGEYENPLDALAAYAPDRSVERLRDGRGSCSVFMDPDFPELQGDGACLRQVRDVPAHHGRRQFGLRSELVLSVDAPQCADKGGPVCS